MELRVSFAGQVSDTDVVDQWIDTSHDLVVTGTTKERRSFGLDRIGLDYQAHLRSLVPRTP